MWFSSSRLLVPLLVAVLLAGCGGGDDEAAGLVVTDPVGHVHAVGLDPQDGSVLVAAHNGMFRAEKGATRATAVGDERRDVMGFSVEAPGRYVGSGHPDVRSGGPSSVGFIRSTDGGRSWNTISLEGQADLHAIEVAGQRVYAFDALSGKLLRSVDAGRTWRATSTPPILDLAVDPRDPRRLVVSTEMGILASRDGGKAFRPVVELPLSQLAWGVEGVTAIGEDQVVQRIGNDLRTVKQLGRSPVIPAAVTQSGPALLVAADDGAVHTSKDGGRTWNPTLVAIE